MRAKGLSFSLITAAMLLSTFAKAETPCELAARANGEIIAACTGLAQGRTLEFYIAEAADKSLKMTYCYPDDFNPTDISVPVTAPGTQSNFAFFIGKASPTEIWSITIAPSYQGDPDVASLAVGKSREELAPLAHGMPCSISPISKN